LLDISAFISHDEMKYLVLTKRKTHQEISDMLKERHPGIMGLSLISVRRFCVKNGIRTKKFFNGKEAEKEVSKSVTTFLFNNDLFIN